MTLARKSVRQNHAPSPEVLRLMNDFRQMTNDCIRIGRKEGVSTLKGLSRLSYQKLTRYELPSYYRLCAIRLLEFSPREVHQERVSDLEPLHEEAPPGLLLRL